MLTRIDRAIAYITIFLGIGHITATPAFYTALTDAAVWFAGGGLCLIFVGLLNLARQHSVEPFVRRVSLAANLVALPFFTLIPLVVPVPQAYLALLLVVGSIVLSVRRPAPALAVR